MDELVERLELLAERLRTAYDGIGHSSGRPYVYFVYPPEQERAVRRLVDEHLRSSDAICYHPIDLLPLAVDSLKGQEDRRQALLDDPVKGAGAAQAIVRLWARQVARLDARWRPRWLPRPAAGRWWCSRGWPRCTPSATPPA